MKKYLIFSVLTMTIILTGCVKNSEKNGHISGNVAENQREVLKTAVHIVAQGLANIAVNYKGSIDTSLIKKFITNIHFLNDNSGYFFVNDFTNYRVIVDPVDTNLIGKSGFNIKDSRGNYYFRLMAQKAQSGGGFVDNYVWNPKLNREQIKETYVEIIPNTNFYLAAGQYIDENAYPRYR